MNRVGFVCYGIFNASPDLMREVESDRMTQMVASFLLSQGYKWRSWCNRAFLTLMRGCVGRRLGR